MQLMEEKQSHQEDHKEMSEMNINEFLQTARQYLFGLMPAPQPVLARIPAHPER